MARAATQQSLQRCAGGASETGTFTHGEAARGRPSRGGNSAGPASHGTVVLLPFVLTSFAANSLIIRHVVSNGLFEAGLLNAFGFISGALALLGIALVRRERPKVGRSVETVTVLGVVLLAATGLLGSLHRSGPDGGRPPDGDERTLRRARRGPARPHRRRRGGGPAHLSHRPGLGCRLGRQHHRAGLRRLVRLPATISATTAGSVQLIIPVLTAAGAVLLLKERLSVTLLVATALVGTGMWLGRPPSPRR